jgi:hypothetical protein
VLQVLSLHIRGVTAFAVRAGLNLDRGKSLVVLATGAEGVRGTVKTDAVDDVSCRGQEED